MPPESASAATPPASNDGGDEPSAPPAPIADPNALGTELSEADENALIDRTLGITDPGLPLETGGEGDENKPDDKPDDPPKPNEPAKAGDLPDDKKPAEDAGDATPPPEPKVPAEDEDKPPETSQGIDTSDLWVELEDANGKTFKIGVNDPIPEELVFKNDAQLAELTEARMEMKGTLRDREADLEKSQAEQQSKQSEEAQLASWDNEIQELIGAGLIEAPKVKVGEKDYLQDAAVQKIDTVFKFMASENTKRAAEGKPKIMSFGTAFTLWSSDSAKKEAEEKQKKDNEIAKARGSLVGGSSSSSSGGAHKELYTQGTAGTIHDVDFSDLVE